MANYDREVIIKKLIRRGLKPKYHQGSRTISYFESPAHIDVGIKCLGYLDFLGVVVLKKIYKKRKEGRQNKRDFGLPKGWSFAWFPNREEAEEWVKNQKANKWIDLNISNANVYQTEEMEYRACLEGSYSEI